MSTEATPAQAGRPGKGPLTGQFVALRPLDPARDAAVLWPKTNGDAHREAVWAYMSYGPFADVSALQAQMQSWAASLDPLWFTVVDKATDTPVGVVSFLNIKTDMRTIELGHIWYAPDAQRTAANTEATLLMLRESFDVLGYRRVEWKCDALNERSRRAALRLGFAYEGVFRQHMLIKGRNRDTAWFAMTDADWPAHRTRLEERLYGKALGEAPTPPIRWRIRLRSTPEDVFALLSTAEGRRRFWAESAEQHGSRIAFRFRSGEQWDAALLENAPPSRFRVSYLDGSTVSFVLVPDGAGGTDLELTETGVSRANWSDNHAGWVTVLLALKAAADHGIDLRNGDPQRSWAHGYVDV